MNWSVPVTRSDVPRCLFFRRRPRLPSESGETGGLPHSQTCPEKSNRSRRRSGGKKVHRGEGEKSARALLPSIHFPQRRAYKKRGEISKAVGGSFGPRAKEEGIGGWGGRG